MLEVCVQPVTAHLMNRQGCLHLPCIPTVFQHRLEDVDSCGGMYFTPVPPVGRERVTYPAS